MDEIMRAFERFRVLVDDAGLVVEWVEMDEDFDEVVEDAMIVHHGNGGVLALFKNPWT